jgi:hypothetical protein
MSEAAVIPCQVLSTAGPYIDNRRGRITVERFALDHAEIVITIPPAVNAHGTIHRLSLAGANRVGLIFRARIELRGDASQGVSEARPTARTA